MTDGRTATARRDKFSKAEIAITLTGEQWFAWVAWCASKPLSLDGKAHYRAAAASATKQLADASDRITGDGKKAPTQDRPHQRPHPLTMANIDDSDAEALLHGSREAVARWLASGAYDHALNAAMQQLTDVLGM